MKIGITGHQKLNVSKSWQWVEQNIHEVVRKCLADLVGISSLAIGTDQIFAKLILRNGGTLHVIIPFEGYETKFDKENEEKYFSLLQQASLVETLPSHLSDEESYFAAGKRVVDLSDIVIAVWDGKPARGLGGTADAVKYAIDSKKKVFHINPVTSIVRIIE
jgi:uncharacterized phage-like protein YoqJ